jgi:LPXTG-motif cell wall-anchored protein
MDSLRTHQTSRLSRILFGCVITVCVGLLASVTQAQAVTYPVPIDGLHFPDQGFQDYVHDHFDADGNGELSEAECDAVANIDPSPNKYKIVTLEGLEYFQSLKSLRCFNNLLTSLDVSNNSVLESLECSYNLLTSLDASSNPALVTLICRGNQLTSLDVSNNPALVTLNCDDNKLTSFGAHNSPSLRTFYCGSNQLTSLDVSNNPALVTFDCGYNKLATLDVSGNPALVDFYCSGNKLTSLDVRNNPALKELICRTNQLTFLDVRNNPALETLYCSSNKLTSLDVRNNPALVTLECSSNQLASLDVSDNHLLGTLYCDDNQLVSLNVSDNPALRNLRCHNNSLTSLGAHNSPLLGTLECHTNQLTSLDVRNNPALETLYCSSNKLTSLDVRNNPALETLYCSSNKLTSLDVRNNPALVRLLCSSNHLLDVAGRLPATGFTFQWGGLQTVTVNVHSDPVNPGSYLSNGTYDIDTAARHTINFPNGEANYDPTTKRFTVTVLDAPVIFETAVMSRGPLSGTITFSIAAICTVAYAPGAHGTWPIADETYSVFVGDPVPVFGAKSGASTTHDHEAGWMFAGWDSQVIDPINGDMTYTALWIEDASGGEGGQTDTPGEEGQTVLPRTGDNPAFWLAFIVLIASGGITLLYRRRVMSSK